MKIKKQDCNFEKLNEDVKILKNINTGFFVLDDSSYLNNKDIKEVLKEIQAYKYKVDMINLDDIMLEISTYLYNNKNFFKNIDLIVAIGEGGSRSLNSLNKYNIYTNIEQKSIVWSRNWNGEDSDEFVTNIEKLNLRKKKVLIIEDVIATGETLYNIIEKIKQMEGEVIGIISAIISGQSPIKNKSFCKMLIGIEVNSDSKIIDNPFWYPPIYSLRHLFYGDKEMPYFYNVLNKRYFNNETKLEDLIKKRRK